MKAKDALKIGWKNIRVHPKQSLLVMGVMGVIFGLIFTVNLWLKGLENTYAQQAGWATDGKVIILASAEMNGVVGPVEDEPETADREEMVRDIERFGGKVVGEAQIYGTNGSIVLDQEYLSAAITADIREVSGETAPVLVSATFGGQLLGKQYTGAVNSAAQKIQTYQGFREALVGEAFTNQRGEEYFVAGLAPGGFAVSSLSFKQIERNNTSLLNPLLGMISVPSAMSIAIDNGGEWVNNTHTIGDSVRVVAVFEDAEQAYKYFDEGEAAFLNVERAGKKYLVTTIAGMAPDTQYLFRVMRTVAGVACVVLAVVAMIVVIFTTIRLVDQEKRNIALYYSLGATSGQVYAICFAYFGLLILGAAILALGLALAITLIYSAVNQELLRALFMTAFSLPELPKVVLCGVSWEFFGFVGLMLLAVPVSVFINRKHIAKLSAEKVG